MSIHRRKIIIIRLIFALFIVSLYNQNNPIGMVPSNDNMVIGILNDDYLDIIEPIIINNNNEIDLYAQNNNLLGNGTKEFPYIIDSVLINGTYSEYAISLYRTTRYLEIRSSYLIGGLRSAIKVNQVTNLLLFNNTIDRSQFTSRFDCCENVGIQVAASTNVIIEQNLIQETKTGIELTWASIIPSHLSNQGNNIILNNTIHNVANGIVLSNLLGNMDGYIGNIIKNNLIWDTIGSAIYLQGNIPNNLIYGNRVNGPNGIIIYSSNNTVSYNYVLSDYDGIILNTQAVNNNIDNNTVYSNSFSMVIGAQPSTENNSIQFNNFITGNRAVQYAADKYNNILNMNYYSDHDLTDVDQDGFADNPYITGYGNIYDMNPLVEININSFEALNLHFRTYESYNDSLPTQSTSSTIATTTESTTTSSINSSVTITTTVYITSSPVTVTVIETTNGEPVTITNQANHTITSEINHTTTTTIIETLFETSTITDVNNKSSNSPSVLGNSSQFYFLIFTLFTVFGLKKKKE